MKNVKGILDGADGRTKMSIIQWQSEQKKIKGEENITLSTRKRKQKATENSGHEEVWSQCKRMKWKFKTQVFQIEKGISI